MKKFIIFIIVLSSNLLNAKGAIIIDGDIIPTVSFYDKSFKLIQTQKSKQYYIPEKTSSVGVDFEQHASSHFIFVPSDINATYIIEYNATNDSLGSIAKLCDFKPIEQARTITI